MTKIEDPLWVKAKEITKIRSNSTDWAYTLSIYKYMGGTSVGIKVTHDNSMYLLAGILTSTTSLLYDLSSNKLVEVPEELVRRDKKTFIKTSRKNLLYSGNYTSSNKEETIINMDLIKKRPLKVYGEVN